MRSRLALSLPCLGVSSLDLQPGGDLYHSASGPPFGKVGHVAKIRTLAPLVPRGDGRTVKVEPKRADPFYQTVEYQRWRELVLSSAGHRCEWIERAARCSKAAPRYRMFADHIKERRDGGDPYDPRNGQCLCGSHHTIKTAAERAKRARGGGSIS